MSNYRNIDTREMADIFKALSNPHRLAIFKRLSCCATQGTTEGTEDQICECVGALGKDLGIAPSTVSHHLKELHRAGLIEMRRRGQTVECWVDRQVVDSLAGFFKQPISV
jgi:DNA-binding transcriptional ArsR family regulator